MMRARCRITLFVVTTMLLASVASAQDGQQLPVTGDAAPGLESLDQVVLDILERRGVPGASLAVVKDGKLVLARGYGWADVEAQQPVRPEMLFGLASCSKSITAVTVLKLVEQGKLSLDDKVLSIITNIQSPDGTPRDPRWQQITIRMLLNHSGAWRAGSSTCPTGSAMLFSSTLARPLKTETRDLSPKPGSTSPMPSITSSSGRRLSYSTNIRERCQFLALTGSPAAR